MQHDSVSDEIQTLAAYIDWYLTNHPNTPAGEVLVTVNRRKLGNAIKDALNTRAQQNNRQWMAQSFYFEDALSAEIAAEGFSLLTMLVEPEDRPALRYWLGENRSDARRLTYARLRQHCSQNNISPRMALEALAAGTLTLPHTATLVTRFQQLQQRLAALMPLGIPELIDALFPNGNAGALAVRQAALLIVPNVQTPRELLNELRTDITQPELPGTQGPAIRIMSLHKSKGLTARLVVIAGCVQGILPLIDYTATIEEQNRQREEARRLFYVGHAQHGNACREQRGENSECSSDADGDACAAGQRSHGDSASEPIPCRVGTTCATVYSWQCVAYEPWVLTDVSLQPKS